MKKEKAKFVKTSCNADLMKVSLEQVMIDFEEKFGTPPTTLCVSLQDVYIAYEIMVNSELKRLLVVPIPGFPLDAWFVCSTEGLIYSEGA